MMKKMLLIAFFAISFARLQAQNASAKLAATESITPYDQKHFYGRIPLVSNVIDYARKHLTIRYRSGGATTHGFDCSGFTRFCFNKFGVSLPHSSAAQGNVGQAVDKDDAQPGDLILFKGHSASGSRIGHVGLITEVGGKRIKFIHSAWSGGVRYDYLNADYYRHRFMGVRRVVTLLAVK